MDVDTYLREQDLVFGYLEFHPEWFDICSQQEWVDITTYYAVNVKPDNYIEWRASVLAADPDLASRAHNALHKVLDSGGISNQLETLTSL